jgi:hypothetical protein
LSAQLSVLVTLAMREDIEREALRQSRPGAMVSPAEVIRDAISRGLESMSKEAIGGVS